MKKFLSILLALAVGFTFTFGSAMSAFAATSTDDSAADTYTTYQKTLTKEYETCVANLSAQYKENIGTVTNVIVDKTVYETIAKEVYNTYMSVLEAQNAAGSFVGKLNNADKYGDLNNKGWEDVDTQDEFNALVLSTGSDKPYLNKTMELAFDGYKDYVIAELNKINLALYADKEMTDADYNAAATAAKVASAPASSSTSTGEATSNAVTTGNLYKVTYKQYVSDLRDKTITDVKAIGIAQLTNNNAATRVAEAYEAVAAKLAVLDTTASATTESVYYTVSNVNTFVSYELADAQAVPTIKDLDKRTLTNDATVASLKAQVDSKAAIYISIHSNTADEAANATKLANAYKEVMYSRIENAATLANFNIPEVDATENTKTFTQIKKLYADLEDYAATAKVMVNATGALIYDAATIDKNLVKVKIEVYDGDSDYSSREAVVANAKVSEQSLDWTKECKIAALNAEMKDALYEVNGDAKYYDLEQKKIEALYQAQIDKINAAATKAQLDAIPATVSIPATITDKEHTVITIKALTQFATDKAKLVKYVELLNGDTKSWEAGYKAMMGDDTLADFYATNNARTNTEVAALFDAAKAECDKLPTKGEIATAKAAAEEVVKALPGYITIENKEAVEAAYKAAADLEDNYGVTVSNSTKLQNAILQLKNAELAKLDAAVKALPAKLTAADKATVEALLDEIEAYETSDMYASVNANGAYQKYDTAKKIAVEKAAEKVRTAALNDVINAIAALPADATKEQVETVKALYDAFVKDYTDAEAGYNAAAQVTNYEKLSYLIAQIETAFGDAEAKAYVQDLAVTVRTAKSGKKVKVTVNADVQTLVDNGYTVTYKFYKSTKKSSGYKNTVNKPTNTYTNTNPVKGKNYYKVKLVVKNADGTVVATTPLTQCKYGVRTIK